MAGLLDSLAVAISLGLQYGVPLEVFIRKFRGMTFEPRGFTKNKSIRTASSIVDYLAKWLEEVFVETSSGPLTSDDECTIIRAGNICPICGRMMKFAGKCQQCECGHSTGCG